MFKKRTCSYHTLFLMALILTSGLAVSLPLTGAEGLAEEARQLLIRTDRNCEPEEYEGVMLIRNYRPGQEPQENKVQMRRKGDKMLIIFVEPPSQRGQVFIRDGDDMWMYLPRSKKVMRVGTKDAFMGGEASNADLMRTAMADDYNPVYQGEEVMAGVVCHKLELTAKKRTVAYDRVIYWIAKEDEIPVRRDYYALSGKKLRVMYFEDVKILGGIKRPARIRIENAEQKGYWTELIFEKLNPDAKWEDYIFTPAYVKQGLFY
ncbi:MAG: outer membrane lipoprotein-sorting protein [Firmicutes bacterium]|nr:outer membrane lipoprotein-sorting protein [Bacillota bacterium]